jgi:hypothetical protein
VFNSRQDFGLFWIWWREGIWREERGFGGKKDLSSFIFIRHSSTFSTTNNTHTMTTAAPSSTTTTSLLAEKRRELLSLDTQKKSLQSEAEAIVLELTAKQPGGVSSSTHDVS